MLPIMRSAASELLRSTPLIYEPMARRREESFRLRRVVRPGDTFVIDGFPRSANTFATHAFLLAQRTPILLGNHTHAASQFHLARSYRVPALLVIREPLGAVASAMVYDGGNDPRPHLVRYIIFHRSVRRSRHHFEVGRFDEVTRNFAGVIARVNARYGSHFLSDYGSDDDVFNSISLQQERVFEATGVRDNSRSTMPSSVKAEANAAARKAIESKKSRDLLSVAMGIYAEIAETS